MFLGKLKLSAVLLILIVVSGLVSPPSSPKNAFAASFELGGSSLSAHRWGNSLKVTSTESELPGVFSIFTGSTELAAFASTEPGDLTLNFSSLQEQDLRIEYQRLAVEDDFQNLTGEVELTRNLKSGVDYVFTSIRIIPVDSANSTDAAHAATLPDRTFLRYLTYIPSAYVAAPPTVCTFTSAVNLAGTALLGPAFQFWPHEFEGNNRSWDPDEIVNSKTSFSVGINWPLGGKLTSAKYVGPTRLFANILGSRLFVAQGQALTDGMVLVPHSLSSTLAVFEMIQDVTNPLCLDALTNGITFDYNFTVWRSGGYSINGVSIAAPNHELYIIDSGDPSWKPVMRRTLNSFDCFAAWNTGNDNCTDKGTYVGSR